MVRRYDIDGVHIDDYFYPYPEPGRRTFRDRSELSRAIAGLRRPCCTRADWRRSRTSTRFIEAPVSGPSSSEKPWVKFGISPFGIWRPGVPRRHRGR